MQFVSSCHVILLYFKILLKFFQFMASDNQMNFYFIFLKSGFSKLCFVFVENLKKKNMYHVKRRFQYVILHDIFRIGITLNEKGLTGIILTN